jgi:hypothetical protein
MATVRTYQEAETYLGKKNSRKLNYGKRQQAVERRPDGVLAVRMYETDVVTYFPDGRVQLSSGGWKTVTTKERINNHIPTGNYVSQERGVWYLRIGGWQTGTSYVFADGMTIMPDGSIVGAEPKTASSKFAKLRRQAAGYAKDFVEALHAGKIGLPGTSDCFYCGMSEVGTGKNLGELNHDGEHIRTHIEERYYVPSLLINAIKMFGVGPIVKDYALVKMGAPCPEPSSYDFVKPIADRQLKSSVRRYVLRQLGMAA